jgi:hypothetical protein
MCGIENIWIKPSIVVYEPCALQTALDALAHSHTLPPFAIDFSPTLGLCIFLYWMKIAGCNTACKRSDRLLLGRLLAWLRSERAWRCAADWLGSAGLCRRCHCCYVRALRGWELSNWFRSWQTNLKTSLLRHVRAVWRGVSG